MSKFMLASVAVLLASTITTTPGFAGNSEDLDEHLKKAAAAVQGNNIGDAEREYQKALRSADGLGQNDPKLRQTLDRVALFYKGEGKQAFAQQLIVRSIKLKRQASREESADLADSLRDLGLSLLADGRAHEAEPQLQEAVDTYTRVLDRNPNGPESKLTKLALADCIDQLAKVLELNQSLGFQTTQLQVMRQRSEDLRNAAGAN